MWWKKYVQDFKDIISLLRKYFCGDYTEAPYKALAAMAVTLLYILSPIDLLPDIIPLAGFADDAIVLGLCLKFAQTDIEAYRSWKDGQS